MLHPRISRSLAGGLASLSLVLFVGCGAPDTASDGTATYAAGDVEPRVAEILALDDRLARTGELAMLLRTLPPSFLDEVLSGFDGAFLEWGDNELVLLAEWWTRFDPSAAKRWSETEWRAEHPRVALTVMRTMARTDPQLAVRTYFDAQQRFKPEPGSYPGGLEAIIIGWYESGKDGLLAFVTSQPDTQLRQQTMGTLARLVVLDLGPEAAIEWADARVAEDPSELFGRQLQQRIAAAVAEDSPDVATAWVERLVAEGAHHSLMRRVSVRWAKENPEGALRWLETFDEGPHTRQAIAEAWNVWWLKEPKVARQWLLDQGDDAYGILAPALARSIRQQVTVEEGAGGEVDYPGFLAHSVKIEYEPLRWGSVAYVARFWRLHDEAAAEAWIEEHGVPERYRGTIRGPVPGGVRSLVRDVMKDPDEG